MSPTTRRIILGSVAVLLIGGFAAWWFSGFSLEFMRFFAAKEIREIPSDDVFGRPSPPPGCYYKQVQCIQAPCDPVLFCPGVEGIVVCAPDEQTVQVGQGAALTAEGGVGSYQWFIPGGVLMTPAGASGNTVLVSYSIVGTKKVTVQATRSDGVNVDSVSCTVHVTP